MNRLARVPLLCLLLLLASPCWSSYDPVDRVRVVKSERRLYLFKGEVEVARFAVALGGNPVGPKRSRGDQRTPEGHYVLDYRNPHSRFYRSIHVSYPNAADRAAARRSGVDPGGDIMIHGQPNGLGWLAPVTQRGDWTLGCIALADDDMDRVWTLVRDGTPIEIAP